MNDVQDEIAAIETALITGPIALPASTVASLSVSGGSTFAGPVVCSSGVTISTGTLTINQGQIIFPATQVASASTTTFDDYREKDDVVFADASGAGLAFTNVEAHSVKNGQAVLVWGNVTFPATASGANIALSGLPHTPQASTQAVYGGAVTFCNSTFDMRVAISLGNVVFYESTSGTRITNVRMTGLTVTFHASYKAAS